MFDIQTWAESSHVICYIETGDTVVQVPLQQAGDIQDLKDSSRPNSVKSRDRLTQCICIVQSEIWTIDQLECFFICQRINIIVITETDGSFSCGNLD